MSSELARVFPPSQFSIRPNTAHCCFQLVAQNLAEKCARITSMCAAIRANFMPCVSNMTCPEQRIPIVAEKAMVPSKRFIRSTSIKNDLDAMCRNQPRQLEGDYRRHRMYRFILIPEHLLKIIPKVARIRGERN